MVFAERLEHDDASSEPCGDAVPHGATLEVVRIAAAAVIVGVLVATAAASETVRRPAPALTGVTLEGKQLALAKLRGKPVFINVWSSW
jgi:hypothetical protein